MVHTTGNSRRSAAILITAAALLLAACSQEKDAFLNRTFHRLTARDNGWFNANEKLKEVVATIERNHAEDFDEVLPIFIYGSEEQAKAATPELEKCIEKCATVIDRHSMRFKNEEKNNWIDDAYLVIAKSKFYQRKYYDAQRASDNLARRFKGQNRQLEGKLWYARTLIQMEQFAKAQTTLDEVRNVKDPGKEFPHDQLSAVQADLDLKRGKVDDAIVNLERAIEVADKKKDRVRWSFILAQLYHLKGQEDKAVKQYAAVTRMGAPYELDFHARIYEALAFDAGSSKAIRQRLNRMLRDDKHIDHYDMIHYALADLDLKESQDSGAVAHLKTSVRVSTTDTKQKAKSFLKLADLYFDKRIYKNAQRYYDSTKVFLAAEHKRFEEVSTRAEVLGELVEQLAVIEREDSLRKLMELDEKELKKLVGSIIKQKEKEEDARKAAEEAARETPATPIAPNKPPGGATTSGGWYFYNPMTLSRGSAEFKKRWGVRKLEDDWRRKDKGGSAVGGDLAEEEGAEEGDEEKDGMEDWKDPSFYTKDIPKDSSEVAASDERVCEAYYKCGMIYKEKLRDISNAEESFSMLNSRFEECRYTPESYYQLYRIYLEKESTGSHIDLSGYDSRHYANIILERWPDSEFARLVRDPNALQADAARMAVASAEYEQLYREFRQGYYLETITACTNTIANEPRNPILAKYHLLKAMAIGGLKDQGAFRTALLEVKSKFPGTDEDKSATHILAVLDGNAGVKDAPPPAAGPTYKLPNGQHQVALIFPVADGSVNEVKVTISDFNAAYFPTQAIQITSSMLDKENHVILLGFFPDKQKAMEYYGMFMSPRPELAGVNDQGYAFFAITPENYTQFYKNKDIDGYAQFFDKNYLEPQ